MTYGGEAKRVDLDTQGGHVLLLEFTSQVALDEGGLNGTGVIALVIAAIFQVEMLRSLIIVKVPGKAAARFGDGHGLISGH
jgi:hypothetical protein